MDTIKITKSAYFRYKNGVLRACGYSKTRSGAIIQSQIRNKKLPKIVLEWEKEKKNSIRTRKRHSLQRANADMPRFNKDRTPDQIQIAKKRAFLKHRRAAYRHYSIKKEEREYGINK